MVSYEDAIQPVDAFDAIATKLHHLYVHKDLLV